MYRLTQGLAAYSNFGDAHWDRQRPLFRSQVAATATRCLAIEDSVTLLAPIPLTETTVQMDCVPSVRPKGNTLTRKRALVVMGMQNDFLLGGAVSIGGAVSLIPV